MARQRPAGVDPEAGVKQPPRPVATATPPLESPAARLHSVVSQEGRRIAATILSSAPSAEAIREVVDRAADLGAAYMARSPTNPALLACKKGCSTCCSRPIVTTAPSVLRLAAWLRKRLSPAQLTEVQGRVAALDDVTHGKLLTPQERAPNPCALLVDGACSVYEVRPFVCRGWNAVDVEQCKRALVNETIEMRFDLYQRTTYAAVEDGVKRALADAGLDTGDLELAASLRVALERPDATEAWLAGQPVFAGCEAKLADATRRSPSRLA